MASARSCSAIQRQPDANTVQVVDSIRAKLPALRAQVPPSIRLETLMDRSISVRQAVFDVQETLLIAIGLVIMVIFLFLRSASATAIPALAVPISLVGTCAAMYVFGFSINNMTLLALTLSVGFVVDDAIVMLENIVRHIEGGMRPFEAALKGAREIGFTIISITFSLIAVFIPVLLMGGVVGRVFREFAVTISVAIIVSGFVSLTLTPMLCARMLRGHREDARQNIVLRIFEAMFNWWLKAYEWSLDKVIAYKAVMLAITFGTVIGTVWLYIVIPKGFFPLEDTGFIIGVTEAATDTSFEAMVARQRRGRRYHPRRIRPSSMSIPRSAPAVPTRPPIMGACSSFSSPRRARAGEPGHRAPAAEDEHGARNAGLLPEHPEHQYRRTHLQERVSVYAAKRRYRGALSHRARDARQVGQARRPAGCHH